MSALLRGARLATRTTTARLVRFYAFPPHTVINMPALSPTMTQGNIASWSKLVGDQLQAGEAIAEIETDKALMDFEFQDEGYLAKILLADGSKDVPIGKPIAVYVEEESDVAAFESFTEKDAKDADQSSESDKSESDKKEEHNDQPQEGSKVESQKSADKDQSSSSSSVSKDSNETSKQTSDSARIFASPLAKTIAIEKGIKLKGIKGSGPGGRILAKDLESVTVEASSNSASTQASSPASSPAYEDIPLTSMRKTIASRLLSSTQSTPSYIIQSQISVSKLLKLRQSLNSTAEDRYRLSVNDLLIKAIAVATKRVPNVNVSWLGDKIRRYESVDVSVAVATDTGLITPIVFEAHSKPLSQISKEIKDLGKKAKTGKLSPAEYQGGTICISNLGMNHSVTAFTSIINPPQSAIIAIGTTEKKAVPSNDVKGFTFDDVITITGTFDHRSIDGALGGEWMKELKRVVENPLEMLV